MTSMGVQAALAVLLLFIATANAGQGEISFWRESFRMTCPGTGDWYDDKDVKMNGTEYIDLKYEKKGSYYCKYDQSGESTKYYFYVQGKVCHNCFELDGNLFMLVILMDLIGTLCVMMTIWRCTKKKSSAGLTQPARAPPRSGGRAQPVQSSDYEQLNPNTRSQGTYSVVNRTG